MGSGKHFYNKARSVAVGVAAIAIGDNDEVAVFSAPFAAKITKLAIVPNAGITGADTNYYTLGFKNKGAAGAGTASVASKAYTSGVDVTAFDEDVLAAGTEMTNAQLAKGDTLTFHKTETANGLGTPDLLVIIDYKRV